MKRVISSIVLGLYVLGFHIPEASASGYFFSPALFYRTEETKTEGGNETELTHTMFDIRLGYIMTSSFYLGAIYAQDTRDTGDNEFVRSSYGPTLGFIKDEFVILFHYFISSEDDYETVVYEGTGMQLDIGYYMRVGSSTRIGPQLSYKKFTYTKNKDGSLDKDREETRFEPYVAFAWEF